MTFEKYLRGTYCDEAFIPMSDGIKFYNNSGKAFFLLYEDLDVCLQKIWENLPEGNDLLHGSWVYEEREFRKVFSELLNKLPGNTVTAQVGSQTINTIKILGLYAAFLASERNPLHSFSKKIYIDPNWIEKAGETRLNWRTFLGWLKRVEKNEKKEKYTQKSVQSYYGAVKKNLSEIAGISLLEIDNIAHYENYKSVIVSNQQYIDQNNTGNRMYSRALDLFEQYLRETDAMKEKDFTVKLVEILPEKKSNLPKPFILLAGISGTGKTRFVAEQAKESAAAYGLEDGENFCLVPVRPDWHEPSDLLGYVSRIGTEQYVPTNFLRFMVRAWEEVFAKGGNLNGVGSGACPFWLCLDEMNLAPVEQYFADYLSILETREWRGVHYTSKPLLSDNLALVRIALGGKEEDPVWNAFEENNGIPLPPNLIVAGTVNMDETTHGFSRKVIDRALTLDFQEFFPNEYDRFFEGQAVPKTFTFLHQTRVEKEQLNAFTAGGEEMTSLIFLKKVNEVLTGTPFELGYRALNELFLAEVCFAPEGPEAFQALWDDFLMQKVLPRIEGDAAKLKHIHDPTITVESLDAKDFGKGTVLHALYHLLESEVLSDVFHASRPDLLRDTPESIDCRSKKKLQWMMRRLKTNHFTDFWV